MFLVVPGEDQDLERPVHEAEDFLKKCPYLSPWGEEGVADPAFEETQKRAQGNVYVAMHPSFLDTKPLKDIPKDTLLLVRGREQDPGAANERAAKAREAKRKVERKARNKGKHYPGHQISEEDARSAQEAALEAFDAGPSDEDANKITIPTPLGGRGALARLLKEGLVRCGALRHVRLNAHIR